MSPTIAERNAADAERRRGRRATTCMAVELNSASKKGRCGIARNVGERGLLVVTRSRFHVGDVLELGMHDGPTPKRLRGRIQRIDETLPDELWRWSVAIELEGVMPGELLERGRKAG